MLKTRCLLFVVMVLVFAGYYQGWTPVASAEVVPLKVERFAEPFELSEVRLLDGPFHSAMQRNIKYLLELEPDRLLTKVRENAGLEPKADHYGGWEAQGIASHSLGHYLSACAMQYAVTGDERFRERVEYIVEELAACQAESDDGYVSGIPRGREIFAEVEAGDIRSQGFDLNGGWVPWYTMHKLLAGLRDAYLYCDSGKALEVLTKLADFCWSVIDGLDDKQMQQMLACEHGGMNEIAADLYRLTGEDRYLQMAEKFYHKWVLDPLAKGEDRLTGLHANTQVPKVIGAARLFEITAKPKYAVIASNFWNRVVHHYTYVNGGNSYYESFGPQDRFADCLHDTTETCNTYNMLKLTRHLFSWQPDAELMDFYERALLNHILAHQHPDSGMFVYKGFLDPATNKHFSTPFDSFWCCVGTGMENHVKYGESIYYRSGESLFVNLFISSQLIWKQRGLKLTQQTDWPYGDHIALTLEKTGKPAEFSIFLRYPYWATKGVSVRINGKPIVVDEKRGEYIELRRQWKDDDEIVMELPMELRYESMPDNENMLAFFYGPTLLAAVQEDKARKHPALKGEKSKLLSRLRLADPSTLTFESEGLVRSNGLNFIPLFRVADQRYSVYMEHFDDKRWEALQAARAEEERRRKELEIRTVDFFQPGEMQPERNHALTGEKTRNGRHHEKAWRDAYDGGWFSFEMAVDSQSPMELVCTYWGDDAGGRVFDILVEGQKVATQTLDRPRPGSFVDITYQVPIELTKGKKRVLVRLQGHEGKIAGGLFGCRMLREKPSNE